MNSLRFAIYLLALLILSQSVCSLEIRVFIKGDIGGILENLSYEKNAVNLQRFFLIWYNSQSVGCDMRVRVDIKNTTNQTIATLWSKKRILEPGATENFEVFWVPEKNGSYTASVKAYVCKEIFDLGSYEFNATVEKRKKGIILSLQNTPKGLEASVKANLTNFTNDVVIIPKSYPLGWVFEQERVKLEKGEKKVLVNFECPRWKSERVSFIAVATDGMVISNEAEIVLKKKQDVFEIVKTCLLYTLLFVSLSSNFVLFKKYSKFRKRSRK